MNWPVSFLDALRDISCRPRERLDVADSRCLVLRNGAQSVDPIDFVVDLAIRNPVAIA